MFVSVQEFEREHQAHSVLQFHFKEMKETLRHTEELLTVSYCTRSVHAEYTLSTR